MKFFHFEFIESENLNTNAYVNSYTYILKVPFFIDTTSLFKKMSRMDSYSYLF